MKNDKQNQNTKKTVIADEILDNVTGGSSARERAQNEEPLDAEGTSSNGIIGSILGFFGK